MNFNKHEHTIAFHCISLDLRQSRDVLVFKMTRIRIVDNGDFVWRILDVHDGFCCVGDDRRRDLCTCDEYIRKEVQLSCG